MPRQPRRDTPGVLHHVMGRGIDGREIFCSKKDCEDFLGVKSRKLFCQVAVKKMGYSGADVARFLGITTSAVNQLAVSEELPQIKKYSL